MKKSNNNIHLHSTLNRCYVEDFIGLSSGSSVVILVPQRQVLCKKKNVSLKLVDDKLVQIVEFVKPPILQMGGPKDIYYAINATILSTPNRDASFTGIDRVSLKAGLHGTQKYGSIVKVDGCTITPLIKWRDVMNGCKDGIQV